MYTVTSYKQKSGIKRIHRKIAKTVEGLCPERILDIGCGTGKLAECFSGEIFYLGCEPDNNSIAQA